eukprot:jgi/Ulvmu1/1991/UM012_0153.1
MHGATQTAVATAAATAVAVCEPVCEPWQSMTAPAGAAACPVLCPTAQHTWRGVAPGSRDAWGQAAPARDRHTMRPREAACGCMSNTNRAVSMVAFVSTASA